MGKGEGLVRFIDLSSEEQKNYLEDGKGYAYKMVGDKKDAVSITVREGDSITISERGNEVALFRHIPMGDGTTDLQNGRHLLRLQGNQIYRVSEVTTFEFTLQSIEAERKMEAMKNSPYQSVGLTMEDGFWPVLFDHANHVESEDGRFRLNSLGFALSRSRDQVQMQTSDDLQAKYGFPVKLQGTGHATPNLILILDAWFDSDAQKQAMYGSDGVLITDKLSASNREVYNGKSQLIIGEMMVDPFTYPLMPIRTVKEMSTILDHEFTHGWEHMANDVQDNKRLLQSQWAEIGIPEEIIAQLQWKKGGLSMRELQEQKVSPIYLSTIKSPGAVLNDIVIKQFEPILGNPDFRKAAEEFAIAAVRDRGLTSDFAKSSIDLIDSLNKYYQAKGLPITSVDLVEIQLESTNPAAREATREAYTKLMEARKDIKIISSIFNPESANPNLAAIFAVNKFIDRFDYYFTSTPGYYLQYRESFDALKLPRESLGFFDHSLNEGHHTFLGMGIASKSFAEVTSIFLEQSDPDIQKSVADPGPKGELSKQLLQYSYDIGRINTEKFEYLRGIPCSAANPCERGVLWKMGRFTEERKIPK